MDLTEQNGIDGKMSYFFSSHRLDSSIFWGGMSVEEVILHYNGVYSKLISSNRKLLQLLSFPYDQITTQPLIRYMDRNGCSAKISTCDFNIASLQQQLFLCIDRLFR
jgi:hypothetical protein